MIWAAVSVFVCAELSLAQPVAALAETSGEEAVSGSNAGTSSGSTDSVGTSGTVSWPEAPEDSAEGAILIDAHTGTVLYQKNMNEKLYPASITKMMTCLIAAERLNLDDVITMSAEAVNSVPADGSNVGLDVGEQITVEQALYAIMVGSANEAAAAVAEKVAGSVDAFAELMNERAKELGCTNTHFVNANGLHDENHYTSPHDMALIARAFFDNDVMLRIGNTPSYHFTATATQPDDFTIRNKHELITGEVPCEGVIGGKTGYHSYAGETLVTGCERNGMRLICVVMKEESPNQFTDSADLLNWGCDNFSEVNIADNETRFTVSRAAFFDGGSDLLGDSSGIFEISPDAMVVLPDGVSFDDLDYKITYLSSSGNSSDSSDSETSDQVSSDVSSDTSSESGTSGESMSSESGSEQSTPAHDIDDTCLSADDLGAGDVDGKAIATLTYTYDGYTVGTADLYLLNSAVSLSDSTSSADKAAAAEGISGSGTTGSTDSGSAGALAAGGGILSRVRSYFASMVMVNDQGTIYINIRSILIFVVCVSAVIIVLLMLVSYLGSFNRPEHERTERERKPRRHRSRDYLPHNEYLKYDHLEGEDQMYFENDNWSDWNSRDADSARSSGSDYNADPDRYTGVDNTGNEGQDS